MKPVLTLKLLGNPTIYLNQKEVFFSFSKINALLYYLAVHETVSREEIAGMLWENKDNQTAKKNLRNTIYQANKILGADFIVSPNRTVLALNEDLSVESDVKQFSVSPAEELSLYQGDFLQGFYLKENEAFDFWLSKMRIHYEQIYVKACYQKIEGQMQQMDFEETEASLHRLIAIDEFEEKNYQLLMQFYQENNRPGKVIETYYKLVNVLEKELGIGPNETIRQMYHEILAKDRNERKTNHFLRPTARFFGRVAEIKQLESYFSKILEYQTSHALVLIGGTGIGKRTVTRQVLANLTKYFQIVMAQCFKEENKMPLQVWSSILDGLGDLVIQHQILSINRWHAVLQKFFPSLIEEADTALQQRSSADLMDLARFIVEILQRISKKRALVLLIEDCHWMDSDSLLLLRTIITHLDGYPVAFVLTKHLNTTAHLEHFLNYLSTEHKIDFIRLEPLSQQESLAYLTQELGEHTVSEQDLAEMYRISQGNPFVLSEYVQLLAKGEKFSPLTPAIKASLALKLENLNSREEEVLNYLACFKGAVSLDMLSSLMLLSFEELAAVIETMCQHHLLRQEEKEDEIQVYFSQRILQLYCYDNLSFAKRRILHHHIAQEMENLLAGSEENAALLNEIAYHYKMSKQFIKSLEYELHYLNSSLQFHHELFPIYSKKFGFIEKTGSENHSLVQEQFRHIRQIIDDLGSQYEHRREYRLLLIRFLYMEGRYYIRTGSYQRGIYNIQKVIRSAKELGSMDYLLEGYRQIIYYCIQTENTSEMRHYVELALEAAVQANHHEAIAIHLRLKGLYHLMTGDDKEAVHLIKESINCFSLTHSLRSKYSIQIAAALDYLAEIEQIRGNLQAAIEYQHQAIDLTENKTAEPSIIVFYISLGISYYLQKKNEEAEKIFQKAKKALQSLSFPWKETQLEVYLALITCEKGDIQPALDLLEKKENLLSRYSNPRDKGMIYYLMAVLKYKILTKSIDHYSLQDLLAEDFETYCDVAVNHLNPYRDRRQIENLQLLKEQLRQK